MGIFWSKEAPAAETSSSPGLAEEQQARMEIQTAGLRQRRGAGAGEPWSAAQRETRSASYLASRASASRLADTRARRRYIYKEIQRDEDGNGMVYGVAAASGEEGVAAGSLI